MTTFQMVISIMGIIVSVLTLLGLGVVMKNFWDDKHAEAQASKAEEKEKAKKERHDEIREVIQEEIKPLQDTINNYLDSVTLQDLIDKGKTSNGDYYI